jgi:hypothetical protein
LIKNSTRTYFNIIECILNFRLFRSQWSSGSSFQNWLQPSKTIQFSVIFESGRKELTSSVNPQIFLQQKVGKSIYMDMQATTPVDPRVLDAMLPLMTEQFGNPHSRTHVYGWESEHLVEEARAVVSSTF